MEIFALFFLVSLANVVLQTLKSILTVKSSTFAGATINAIAFMFYTVVLQQLTAMALLPAALITGAANFVGVYVAKWILGKFSKDKLWIVSITTSFANSNAIAAALKKEKIAYSTIFLESDDGKRAIDIYSNSQKESAIVKKILGAYDGVRYHVLESDKRL